MQVVTDRFGTVEVDDDDVLEVPDGIPGFPDLRRVTLLAAGPMPGHQPGDQPNALFWMQSLDDGSLAFLCVQPWIPFPDYAFDVDADMLGIADPDGVRVLNMVTVRRDGGDGDGAATAPTPTITMTANLRAPLVIDLDRRALWQVILTDARWTVATPFATTVPERG